MDQSHDDIVFLVDFAWQRLRTRMHGLTDDEWAWTPTNDERVSVRWRLDHLAIDVLAAPRNATWLGLDHPAPEVKPATGADDAVESMAASVDEWRSMITDPRLDMTAPIGPVGGYFATSTRRAFVLHIADEIIHHGSEAALLRDLYAHQFHG